MTLKQEPYLESQNKMNNDNLIELNQKTETLNAQNAANIGQINGNSTLDKIPQITEQEGKNMSETDLINLNEVAQATIAQNKEQILQQDTAIIPDIITPVIEQAKQEQQEKESQEQIISATPLNVIPLSDNPLVANHTEKDISNILQTTKGNIIPDTMKTGEINGKPAVVFALLNERNERVNVLMVNTLANTTQTFLQKGFTSIEVRGYPTAKQINTREFEPIEQKTSTAATTSTKAEQPTPPIDKKKPKGQERDDVVQAPDVLSAIFMATHCALHKQIKNLKGLIKNLTTSEQKNETKSKANLEPKGMKMGKNEVLQTSGKNIKNGEINVKEGTLTVVPANQPEKKNQFKLHAKRFQQDKQLQLPITTKYDNKSFTMN